MQNVYQLLLYQRLDLISQCLYEEVGRILKSKGKTR